MHRPPLTAIAGSDGRGSLCHEVALKCAIKGVNAITHPPAAQGDTTPRVDLATTLDITTIVTGCRKLRDVVLHSEPHGNARGYPIVASP